MIIFKNYNTHTHTVRTRSKWIAFFEVYVLLLEYYGIRFVIRLLGFALPSLVQIMLEILVVFEYMCRRYASFFGGEGRDTFARRFFLTKGLTRFGQCMIFYQLILIFIFIRFGGEYVSVESIYSGNGVVHFDRILQWFVGSPLLEELVFRILVIHVLYNRVPNPRPVWCVIVSAIIFSFSHLENMIGVGTSPNQFRYALVQIGIGSIAGTLFGLRFIVAHPSVLESLCLHVLNNVIAALWLKTNVLTLFSSGDLFICLALANTILFYGGSIAMSLYTLSQNRVENMHKVNSN